MHNECILCQETLDIICPMCGQEQDTPSEDKWLKNGNMSYCFLTCWSCETEMFCSREIEVLYSTEYKED